MSNAQSKIRNAAENIRAKAHDVVHEVNERASHATDQLGEGMVESAEHMRSGAAVVADRISGAGHYLQESSGRDMVNDVADIIRRHPKLSVGVAVGLGFLIGRMIWR